MDILAGYHTLSKKGRPNEDRFRLLGGGWIMPDDRVGPFSDKDFGQLYAVMDGAGGAPRGRESAALVADQLVNFFTDENIPVNASGVEQILLEANQTVRSWGLMKRCDRPLGATTATVAWFPPSESQEVIIFHVGDTSAFKLNGNGLTVLTNEHGTGRGITRYVGQGSDFSLDISSVIFEPDDVLCLVSDGVTKGMSERDIENVMVDYLGEPHLAAKYLVEKAERRGVIDDITALVLELNEW